MISSPPKGRQTQKEKTEKDGIRVENVWRVCKQQADATLDKQVLKDVPKKKNCRREQHRQYFKLLKKHTPVLFVLLVFAARLTSKALQGRFGSKTTPHPSFFASTNIGSISNNVFNLVQSTWKFLLKRRKTPKNWILLVEKIHVLFSIALIKFIYSFICYGHWTKLAARTFYEETRCIVPCRFRTLEENSRQKRHLHNVVSQFLAPFFSCKFSD